MTKLHYETKFAPDAEMILVGSVESEEKYFQKKIDRKNNIVEYFLNHHINCIGTK